MSSYPAGKAARTLERVYLEATRRQTSIRRFKVILYHSAISAGGVSSLISLSFASV